MSQQIHQQITDRILKALAEGQIPWRKPWLGDKNDGPPRNVLTNLSFRGVNSLLLQMAGFQSKWWAAKRVWEVFGFQVKPQQEGTPVFHGNMNNLQNQTVFNAEQIDGPGIERFLVLETTEIRHPAFDAAEKVIASTKADIRHLPRNGAVYYRPPKDYIELPLKSQFLSGSGKLPAYYATVFHELAHHSEHRLQWLADLHLSVKQRYAIGELRADLCAAFLSDQIGIPLYHDPSSHRMFVGQWMKLMQADNTLMFRVADTASEAAKFILSFSQEQEQSA